MIYPNRVLRPHEAVFYDVALWLTSRAPIVVMSRKQLETKQEEAFALGTRVGSSGHVIERPKLPRHCTRSDA